MEGRWREEGERRETLRVASREIRKKTMEGGHIEGQGPRRKRR